MYIMETSAGWYMVAANYQGYSGIKDASKLCYREGEKLPISNTPKPIIRVIEKIANIKRLLDPDFVNKAVMFSIKNIWKVHSKAYNKYKHELED